MEDRIRRASAVVLVRAEAADAEVYLVRRSESQRFFPGYWAFPGGTLDGDESFEACAVRELAEETGVRLPDEGSLVPAGHLLTPRFAPVRYDTQFFLARAPPGAEPRVEHGELVDGRWMRPSEALARFEAEAFPIPPPVVAMLHAYRSSPPEHAARAVREADGRPHHERFAIWIHPGIAVEPLTTPTLPPATNTNCYFVGDERVLVVDPAPEDPAARIPLAHRLDEIERRGARVEAVVLTHHHHDHVGAARFVAERTGAPVAAHPHTAERLPRGFVERLVDDGELFDLGLHRPSGRRWEVEVLHAPGHTRGHIALFDRRFRALLLGDCFAGVGTVIVDPPEGDMAAYFRTLERFAGLDPSILLPGHGPATPNGRKAIEGLLRHRRERENKVLAALERGPATEQEMLPTVYDDVAPEIRHLGARSLLAHLVKLEQEGRAARSGPKWRLTK